MRIGQVTVECVYNDYNFSNDCNYNNCGVVSLKYRTRSNYSNVLIIPKDNFNYLFRSNSIEQQ